MNTGTNKTEKTVFTAWYVMLLILALYIPKPLMAVELTFSQAPLFLANKVQPNIFFTIDDSGSMDWEVLRSEGSLAIPAYDGFPNSGNVDITPTRTDRDEILESCAGYNVLYYDPSKTYTPWSGVDVNGDAYTDQSITAARWNPYRPDWGTTDLTNPDGGNDIPGYMIWNDDGDGVFEQGECPDPDDDDYNYLNMFVATTGDTGVNNVMTSAQQTNFANWYTYYRKREYVAKKAVSGIIENSTARIGLSTLWNNNNVRTLISDIDDITTPVDTTAQANKLALMNNLFNIDSSGGTPLRSALQDTGEYFLDGGSWASSSPILPAAEGGACQQNFTVLMSDGYRNSEYSTIIADNADADTSNPWDGGSFADTYSDTLADVAMYYYKTDLDTDLANLVPITDGVDENPAQHLVTFTVAFGVNGTLNNNPPNTSDPFVWPQPLENDPTSIDDMRHAAWNSRGLFLNAGDPDNLINSLEAAIASIAERGASAAAVSVNTGSITSDSYVFQARFDSQKWTGEVRAIPILETGELDFDNERNAGVVPTSSDSRIIVTWDGSQGVPFKTLSDLSTTQQTSLDNNQDMLDYIRGDQSQEESNGGSFRNRDNLLGDIINAAPAYVGAPDFNYDDSTYYYFANNNSTRTPMLYVASNDGMLHAFKVDPDSTSDFGTEVFAYVPSVIYEKLNLLSQPGYSHEYLVDGSPNIVDAQFSDSTWHTVLIAGLNSGGQSIYALDVTDPSGFGTDSSAQAKVLWEFTDKDDDGDDSDGNIGEKGDKDLGYTFGQPNIVKIKHPDATTSWVAIFGNGYNNTAVSNTTDVDIGSGTAVLYIVDVETGQLLKKFDTGKNDLSTPNGMSTVSPVDVNGDNIVDYVYGGDLEGNIWKFDLTTSPITDSGGNTSYEWRIVDNAPLFTACYGNTCTTSNRQPITVSPVIGRHPENQGYLIYFGTGTYFLDSDNTALGMQSFYAIWDQNRDSGVYNPVLPDISRSDLLEQKILLEKNVSFGDESFELRVTTNENSDTNASDGVEEFKINWKSIDGTTGEHYGWYMDLVNTEDGNTDGRGERQVSDPVLRNGRIIFTTLIASDVVCGSGGEGWLMELNAIDGSRLDYSPFDLSGDSNFNSSDFITVTITVNGESNQEVRVPVSGKKSKEGIIAAPGIVSSGDGEQEYKYNSTSTGTIEVTTENPGPGKNARVSWKQIFE